MPFDISARIDEWRAQLLDLTKRNRLINFQTGRAGGVLLVHPDPADLWHRLVGRGEALTFPRKAELLGLAEGTAGAGREGEPPGPTLFDPEQAPDDTTGPDVLERCRRSPRLRGDHLLTELSDRHLTARLTRLHLNAHESLTEQGVTILYVAFGFLRWYESSDSQAELRSPLLLVPARLERDSVDAPWRLRAEEEEILPNHSLAQLLASQFKLKLPPVEDDGADPGGPEWRADYYAAVQKCVRRHERWEVLDEAALGTFNFQKLAMWEDLDRNRARIAEHDLCRAIAGDRSVVLRCPADLPTEWELDQVVPPQQAHHILDADSSQHAAVAAAVRGASLVVDGPPGTGKSQTIANTIAAFLAAGKTVLFVSEKAAALEVVKRRLDDRGLGDFCLECHSHKTSKADVLAELGRCLGLPPEECPDLAEEFRQLAEARARLNEYVRELHAVRRPLGLSAYQAHGQLARLAGLTSTSRCPVPRVLERDAAYLDRVADLLRGLAECRAVVEAADRHPWRGCKATGHSLALQDDARYHLGRLSQLLPEVVTGAGLLHRLGFGPERPTRGEWLAALANAERALRAASWWDAARRRELQGLISQRAARAREAETLRHGLAARLGPEAFAAESAPLVAEAARFRSFWARLLPGWWRLRAAVRRWYTSPPPPAAQFRDDLRRLLAYHQAVQFCREVQAKHSGDVLVDAAGTPQWSATLKYLGYLDRLQARDTAGRSVAELRARLGEAVRGNAAARAGGFDQGWEFLTARLFDPARNVSTGVTLDKAPLADLRPWLAERAGDVHRLAEWVRFCEIEREAARADVAPVLAEVSRGEVPVEEAADAFRARFLRLWLDALYERVPALGRFRSDGHERLVERFRELDRRCVAAAPARVRHLLLARPDRPRAAAGAAPKSSELSILLREVNKKRRHLPLRKLFAAAPTLLPRLKPCFMMSPLAVSTYLQSPDLRFDLVIFDEASQVRPHDAVCAIYRGRQLLVAGDQKQLPPTDFFERVLDDDEPAEQEDDGASLAGYESLLDVCCGLGLPGRRLRWHYRSRREQLIAFSNHHFYGGELVTFPSVHDTPDNPAVTFVYVAEGRWKVGAGVNVVEARRTAELVIGHFREHPGQSLGVIAFSRRQQERILAELERLRRAHPELEGHFHEDAEEPFFVKNLETVQGDERAVILLSVGYGPDEVGKVALRFGPLNRPGGERRLNVAITRARERVVVVSSLRAGDIDLSRTGAAGARLLRAYLDYAERGPAALAAGATEADQRDFDSPFEQAVFDELSRRGLALHRQVGCGGFRIDLAVVDPAAPGRYLLGIECDGAAYHSSATARDRDRLRQEVLERLGWRICRIWSTDWLRDREGQVGRVLSALKRARREAAAPEPRALAPPPTGPEREERPAAAPPPPAPAGGAPRYDSIDDVSESALRDLLLDTLRSGGAAEADGLAQHLARRLGFKRAGRRIQERVGALIDRLTRAGQLARTADGRLQLAPPAARLAPD